MEKKHQQMNGATGLQREFSRILTAAVINAHFRQMLLANPDKALATGYAGEAFHLGNEDRHRLSSIRASSLAEFAQQMAQVQNAPRMPVAFSAGD